MDSVGETVVCSPEQKEQLQRIARSTTAGIWRIKRAKIILGTLEGKSVDRLVLDVRVPPVSIMKCRQRFAKEGMTYFAAPGREPTAREANVEAILAFLEHPPDPSVIEWDSLKHRYIGIYFSARQIQTIREFIDANPQWTRQRLALEVCTRFNLYQPNGKMRAMTVVDILKRMDMDNLIVLRPCMQSKRRECAPGGAPQVSIVASKTMELNPRDLGELRIVIVREHQDAELWNAIIREHHYIKSYRLFGPQLRYLVYGVVKTASQRLGEDLPCREACPGSEQPSDQILLAALGFASSAWQLASREAFIGWTEQQRVANLRYVVSNARFLILPWIKFPNLASRILGTIVRRLPRDWEDRYHYRPALLETFVQLDRFTGTCYKAANWIRLGTTDGYSLYGKKQKEQVPSKAVFVYPLTRKFREILCSGGA
jgi:hypothetical protein